MPNRINIPTIPQTTASETTASSEAETREEKEKRYKQIHEEAKWVAFDVMKIHAERLMKAHHEELPEEAPKFFEEIRPLYNDVSLDEMRWIMNITGKQADFAEDKLSVEELQAFFKGVPSEAMKAYEEVQEKQGDLAMDLL